MKRTNLVVSGCLLIAFLFTSCAVNRKVSYDTIKTDIVANANFTYSIATHDQREVVLNGNRDEKFVGYMRSGVAIAYPIGTESGKNFSDDFSVVIKNSLNESGNQAQIIQTRYSDTKQKILNSLVNSQSDRLLLFTVTKWRSDSKPNGMLYGTEVIWSLLVEIFNNKGELLASNSTDGIDPDLDLGMSGSIKKIQKTVNNKFKEKINLLLNKPDIKEALNVK